MLVEMCWSVYAFHKEFLARISTGNKIVYDILSCVCFFVSSVSLRCNNNQTIAMRMLTRITIQLSGHRGSGLVNFEHLDEICVEPKNRTNTFLVWN